MKAYVVPAAASLLALFACTAASGLDEASPSGSADEKPLTKPEATLPRAASYGRRTSS